MSKPFATQSLVRGPAIGVPSGSLLETQMRGPNLTQGDPNMRFNVGPRVIRPR